MNTIIPKKTHSGMIYYYSDYGIFQPQLAGGNFPLTEDYLPILTHEGYIFLGWYYEDNFITLAKVGDMLSGTDLNLYAKWKIDTDENKYLDAEGIKYLWSKINMQDYPNNETLMAVINAIDETKADKEYIDERVASLVDSAPDILNTLNELATAIGNDPNFATTVTNQIASKQDAIIGTAGQFVVIGTNGKPTTKTIPYAEEATF